MSYIQDQFQLHLLVMFGGRSDKLAKQTNI